MSEFNVLDGIARLNAISIWDYYVRRAMPVGTEATVELIIEACRTIPKNDIDAIIQAVSVAGANVLGWYARMSAGKAVRLQSRETLLRATVALTLSRRASDWRDLQAPIALLNHSASKLGLKFEDIVVEATSTFGDAADACFHDFLTGPERRKRIADFGFHEGSSAEGFDYVPLLPEYDGPPS